MTTEILCRFDTSKNKPVVFVPSMMEKDKGTILSWTSGDPDLVPVSYYHTTQPLSAADEEILRNRYMRHFKDTDVVIRHRLPRTTKVLPNLLTKASKSTEPSLSVETTPAPVVKPAAKKAAAKTPAKRGRKPAEPNLSAKVDQLANMVAQLVQQMQAPQQQSTQNG